MKSTVLAITLIPAVALSQSQSGTTHEHGTGRLDIVFSGAELTLTLIVPGVDIVGFERAPETDEDRTLVARAISDLSKPMELFALSEEAGCFVSSANVTLPGETLGQDSASEEAEHTEFQADYQMQCQDMDALKGAEFVYFDRFPNAQRLKIQISRTGEVRSEEVTRAQNSLAF